MSVARARNDPGRRRGRAAQGAEPVDRFHLEAGRRCWPGVPDAAPWTVLSQRRRPHDVLCRAGRDRALSHRDRQLSRQSRLRRADAVGGAAADRRRAALRDLRGDRRSGRGRSLDRSGQRSRRRGADAGAGARGRRRLRRRASRRAAVLQAQARPRRSGGAGARADRCRKSETNERSGKLSSRAGRAASARRRAEGEPTKRRGAGASGARSARGRRERAASDEPLDHGELRVERRAVTAAKLPFDVAQPAAARIDHRRDRHPRLPGARRAGGTDPCGASPRLGGRSRRSGISSGSRRTPGTSTHRARSPASGRWR